jgi:hypothetical protein
MNLGDDRPITILPELGITFTNEVDDILQRVRVPAVIQGLL